MNSLFNFIKYNKRWSFQAVVFVSICSFIWITTYLKLNTARACGAILKFPIIPSIVIPLLRATYTRIRLSSIGKFFGLDRRLTDHRLFAYGTMTVSLIHTVAHIRGGGIDIIFTYEGLTGLGMWASLIVPLFGVFIARHFCSFVQKYSYSAQIIRPHQVGAFLFMSLYGCHTVDMRLQLSAVICVFVYLFDLYLQNIDCCYKTTIENVRSFDDSSFYLFVVKKPHGFPQSYAGQYCMLSFPAMDAWFECSHPFTIMSNTTEHLYFIINESGSWTRKVATLTKHGQYCSNLPVLLSGPYGACIPENTNVFITSGSGITPVLSQISHNIDNSFHVYIYLKRESDMKLFYYVVYNYLPKLVVGKSKFHVFCSDNKTQKRLDVSKVISSHKKDVIYTCGGISKSVLRKCLEKGIRCYSESH